MLFLSFSKNNIRTLSSRHSCPSLRISDRGHCSRGSHPVQTNLLMIPEARAAQRKLFLFLVAGPPGDSCATSDYQGSSTGWWSRGQQQRGPLHHTSLVTSKLPNTMMLLCSLRRAPHRPPKLLESAALWLVTPILHYYYLYFHSLRAPPSL